MINGNINKYLNLEQENIKNKNKEIKEISPENNNLLNSSANENHENKINGINSKIPNEYRYAPIFNICINSIMKEEQQHIEEIIYFRNNINNENNKDLATKKEDKIMPLDSIEKKRDQNYPKDNEIFEGEKEYKNQNKFVQNEKNKIKFNINTEIFRDEKEMQIQNIIENIKDSNLADFEKRLKVLQEEKYIYYKIKDDSFGIKFEENDSYKEKNKNEFNTINNTSENFVEVNNINDSIEIINNNETQENKSISLNDSSLYNSKIDESNINEQSKNEFNSFRTKYYLEHKLYDFCLFKEAEKDFLPDIYKIDKDLKGFVYPNDLKTYCISQSGFLLQKEKKENYSGKNSANTDSGLFFCGKKIIIKNNEEKECSLNHFICFECMKFNKEIYNIKNHYFININGRISKINKGKYHCFGHFLVGNQIEDCINKFTCKACKLLQMYSEYYNPKNSLKI